MAQKTFAKNYIFNLLYQVLSLALPLLTTPYLSRVLGADGIGKYSFAQSVVSYFALAAALGSTLYGQRAIARVSHDPVARSRTFFEILLLRVLGVAVAMAIYGGIVLPRVGDPLLYAVAAIEIVSVALDVTWFYQGMEDFRPIALCTALGRLLAVMAIFLFVRDRGDVTVYVVCYGASLLLGHLLLWGGVRTYLSRVPLRRLRVLRHALPSLALFASQFAIQIYTVLDKTMIGLITRSDFENGYYEQSQKLIRVLLALVTSLGVVMASRVAALWHEEKRERVYELMYGSFRFVLALGLPMAVGCGLILSRFVPLFYGAGFEPVMPILRVLVWLFPVVGCSNVIGIQLLVPTGRERLLTFSVAAGALTNVLLNLMLIASRAAVGAAIASVIAECAVTAMQFFLVRRELKALRVLKMLARYAVLSAIMGVFGLAVSYFAPAGIFGIALIVLLCAAVYGVLLVVLRDPVLRFFRESF